MVGLNSPKYLKRLLFEADFYLNKCSKCNLPALSEKIFGACTRNPREYFSWTWIAIEYMCLCPWLGIAETKLLTHDLGKKAEMQSDTLLQNTVQSTMPLK